jgi:hypothetical protein
MRTTPITEVKSKLSLWALLKHYKCESGFCFEMGDIIDLLEPRASQRRRKPVYCKWVKLKDLGIAHPPAISVAVFAIAPLIANAVIIEFA